MAAAGVVALVAALAVLFLGEVMGMTPCLLCRYQRIAMFPLAVILGMAAFADDRRGAVYALPFAAAGSALAGYHTALIAGWLPAWWLPCGTGPSCSRQDLGILSGIQLPWLSLAAFLAILALLLVYLRRTLWRLKVRGLANQADEGVRPDGIQLRGPPGHPLLDLRTLRRSGRHQRSAPPCLGGGSSDQARTPPPNDRNSPMQPFRQLSTNDWDQSRAAPERHRSLFARIPEQFDLTLSADDRRLRRSVVAISCTARQGDLHCSPTKP